METHFFKLYYFHHIFASYSMFLLLNKQSFACDSRAAPYKLCLVRKESFYIGSLPNYIRPNNILQFKLQMGHVYFNLGET